MDFYSPLRYPGGKRKLADFISKICIANNINGHYVEPYAGGAAVALHLLFNEYVKEITINDLDRSIYAFWYSVLHHADELTNLIKKTDINIDNWKRYRDIQKNKEKVSLIELGFSTLFLNRTNMSGIINGGVIGGLNQDGEYKLDCRFNKKEIIKRIENIARYKESIHLYNLDALELVKKIKKDLENTIFYFDPPYYLKGPSLYLNHYKPNDHRKVSEEIKKIKNAKWIISYDDVLEIKKLYKGFRKTEYELSHTAREVRIGEEVLFFSRNIVVRSDILPVNNA